MKLSDSTIQILKNYSSLNSNIIFNVGSKIATISEARNILSLASVDADFASAFGIYDLNEFLGVLSLVDNPEIKIEEKFAVIADSTGRSKIKYFFTDPSMLTKASEKDDFEVNFEFDQDTLNKIKRACAALGHTSVSITAADNTLVLTVFDPDNPTSNSFSIDIAGTYEIEEFNFILSIANLKIIPGTYKVGLSSKLMSRFVNTDQDIRYWIALEKSSTYGQ
jgi:hypothetical protein